MAFLFRSSPVRGAVFMLLLVGLAVPAEAHRTTSFRACIVRAATCRWHGTVLADGSTARFLGLPQPPHVGHEVRVWRRDPREGVWRKVGTTVVRRWGKIRWAWAVQRADARMHPYWLRFQIPGHGTSTTAHLSVIPPDV